MAIVQTDASRELLDAVIAAFAMLGGSMAYWSGFGAARSHAADEPPSDLAYAVNLGLAHGFNVGAPAAVVALIISLWS